MDRTVSTTSARTSVASTTVPMRSRCACQRSSIHARAMARSSIQIAASAPRAAVMARAITCGTPSPASTPNVIQAVGNAISPTSTRAVPFDTGVFTSRLTTMTRAAGHTFTSAVAATRPPSDEHEHGDPEGRAEQALRVGRRHDVGVGELQPAQGGEVATDVPAHRGLVLGRRAPEAPRQGGAGLERRVWLVGPAQGDLGRLVEGESGLDIGEVGADRPDAAIDGGRELADGVGIVSADRTRRHDVEIDGETELHEGRGAERHLVGERQPDRQDDQVLGARGPRAEGDARGAGLDRVDLGSVVGRALREDGDDVALGEGAVAVDEGVLVARAPAPARLSPVRSPVHEHHADAPQQPAPRTGSSCSSALAMKRGRRPSAVAISTGSTKPLKWLATSSTGRPSGYRSIPATSTRRNSSREAKRATHATTLRIARTLVVSGRTGVSMPAQLARWATTSRYSDGTASAPEVSRLHSLASATSWFRNDVRPSSSSAPQALRVGP